MVGIWTLLLLTLSSFGICDEDFSYKKIPARIRVHLKPDGPKWSILGYGCGEQKCNACDTQKASCSHECYCLKNFDRFPMVGSIPTRCELSEKVECNEVCFRGICRNVCRKKIVKVCENLTGWTPFPEACRNSVGCIINKLASPNWGLLSEISSALVSTFAEILQLDTASIGNWY